MIAAAKPLSIEARELSLDRLLTLRRSCESVRRANHLALLRAHRAFEHSSLLICEAESLRRRIQRMRTPLDSGRPHYINGL